MDEKRMPFFSIIMPVYNGEKYIFKAINSVLNQSFKDFELIVVDDCSTDGTKDVLAKFKDTRIVFTHTNENIGVANARNTGMTLVQGKYLGFVDADDWIDCNVLEQAYTILHDRDMQLLKYGCQEEYFNKNDDLIGVKKISLPDKIINDTTAIRLYVLEMEKLPLFGYLWNSFYAVNFLREFRIKFDCQYQVNEDFAYNMGIIEYVTLMGTMHCCGYHYAKRNLSSLSTKGNDRYLQLHIMKIEMMLNKYSEWNLLDGDTERDIYWLYTRVIYSAVTREIEGNHNEKILLNSISNTALFKKYKNIIFKEQSLKERIMIYFLVNENFFSVILICRMISFIKSNFKVLFARIKE